MGKRKAEDLSVDSINGGSKKSKHEDKPTSTKSAKMIFMDSDDSDGEGSDEDGGVKLEEPAFKINEEYAKRFEYNQKREELQRLKDKYGDKFDEDSDESSSEDEDDDAVLATEDVDAQIKAALNAIKSRDPRRLDANVTFFDPIEDDGAQVPAEKKEKPMYLKDYQRKTLLEGPTDEDGDTPMIKTYAQEQQELKRDLVKSMHEAAASDNSDDSDDEDDFLVPKSKPKEESQVHPSRRIIVDPTTADKDPESYLSNFMEARAWLPTEGRTFQPLESDDEDEEAQADAFEVAYNLRFEDPEGSNKVLKTYARDITAQGTVRRKEENKGRKKQRNLERERKEAEKREREEERAKLRKLKIEETEEKLKKVKKAAGMQNLTLTDDILAKLLDDNWDDKKWEEEMSKGFGDDYYAEKEVGDIDTDVEASDKKKKKVKKPKWDDDIDIKDLVPDFEDEEGAVPLSDESEGDVALAKSKSSKDRKQERTDKKKAARLERKKIEELVDNEMDLDIDLPSKSSKQQTKFRYRETSPTSFGLTPMDILMAPDKSLNEFAGLKRLATFRDPAKKRKDRKNLAKKANLRKWRKETFGNEEGPVLPEQVDENHGEGEGEKKKKKRSKKAKVEAS